MDNLDTSTTPKNVMRLILAYPMIFLQILFLSYLFLTPIYYISYSSPLSSFLFHSSLLLSLYSLTLLSLLRTFRTDPGFLSVAHIEQIKLGLSYMQSEASAAMMEFGEESSGAMKTMEEIEEERRARDETVKDMNRALINTIKKI